MKKALIIVIVVALVTLNVVSLYIAYQRYIANKQVIVITKKEFPNPLGDVPPSKPATFLGDILVSKNTATPSPTPGPKTPVTRMSEVESLLNDDGKSDIDAVKQQVLEL